MDENNAINDFDIWYAELVEHLASKGKRAPYKGSWAESFYSGMSIEEAINSNEVFIVNL